VYAGTAQCLNFLEYPVLSQEWVMLRTSNFPGTFTVHRVHPNRIPFKIWGKNERGRIQDCPDLLSTPIISGTGKAMNFKFCTHVLSIDRNKSPLLLSEKVVVAVLRDSKIFRAPM